MAIVHSDGLPGETRYFQSEKLFQEAVAAFDFDADPFVGFLLRLSDARTGHYRISRNAKVNRKPIKAAELAIEEGRYDEADAIYRKIRGAKGLGYGEKVISGRQGFKVRKIVQEARGGWVDVMPTENAYEAETWWSVLATQKDGRAHMKANKGYYRLELPLPGRNAEYEATVHFETNDVKQTRWFIGWGLARPYTGFCATKSSWAYPYIGFRRDETGDWVSVECPTRENTAKSYVGPKAKYGEDKGYNAKWTVYEGALEKHDSHSFSLAFGSEELSVTVDGKVVWKMPIEEALSQYQLRDNIQPDGTVLPVWKTFKNTSFSGYRYRRLQVEEPKGEDAVRRLTGPLD